MPIKKIHTDYYIEGVLNVKSANLSYQENLDVDSGLVRVVATVSASTCNAAFFDYVVVNGSNVRSGTVVSSHNGSSATFYDNSTTDLGDTSGVDLSVDLSSGLLRLKMLVTTDNWIIKTLIRTI
jgi:hypothetical protein